MSGIVATGDGATNVLTQAETAIVLPPQALIPVAEVIAPLGLVNFPPPPALFVGRTQVLDQLDKALEGPGGVVVQAVHGMGGIGKSTLAAYWAATRATGCTPVWWITADSPNAVDAGLAALGAALQPELSALMPAEVLQERAVQWLATHDTWLLILDNVNDPAHVLPLLSRTQRGRVLITSRRATGWHHLAIPIPIDVLDADEAGRMLTAITGFAPDTDGVGDLCAELGFLPLAVEQAAAYMAETCMTPRDYLNLLTAHPATTYRDGPEGADPTRTIARIWHVTLDHLSGDPLVGDLLRILAWYAPGHIPRFLLDGLASPPELNRAVGRLAAYSLINTHSGATLSMHRLLQAVIRTPDSEDPHRQLSAIATARDMATTQLDRVLLDGANPATWPTWRTLLPHVDALAQHIPLGLGTTSTAHLLTATGSFLRRLGLASRATSHFQRALADRRRLLGEDHHDTLIARSNLAGAYETAGDLTRAIPLYEQTAADLQRVLGEDHRDTLISLGDLAVVYEAAGDLKRAISLHEQTVADQQRTLGETHQDTLTSRNNLAYAYTMAGDLQRAITLYEQTIADQQHTLGEDHQDTLTSRGNLAYAYAMAGDLQRAITLYEQTIADQQRTLGEDHHTALASRSNLAYAYVVAGEPQRAILLYEQTIADQQRTLGEDHQDTLSSRNNLAGAYEEAGELQRAISLYERTVADQQRVLGEDHPHTLTSRNNLAGAYEAAAELEKAIPLYQGTLASCLRVLSEGHPLAEDVRRNLTVARGR